MQDGVASRLAPLAERILLNPASSDGMLPIRIQAWDGSSIGPADAPTFVIRHRRALRRLLWKPGEMGLARAYVAGELDIEGDIFAALGAVQQVMRSGEQPIRLSSDDKREIVRTAVTLGAVGPEPKPPPEEFPLGRAAGAAARQPGPLGEGAAFFAPVLGPTLAYQCARWDDDTDDLEQAQRAAHAAIARRLGLGPGSRVLDLSCGWGAFALYAAAEHGAQVVGLTRSPAQAEHARDLVRRAGLTDLVDIRAGDHTAAGGVQYDAIVALSGTDQAELLAADLYSLLRPGGRLLLQQLTRRSGPHSTRRTFTTSYVFPRNGELSPLGEIVAGLEEAALEVRTVAPLREQYARTLRAWAAGLQRNWAECGRLASPGRARVWLLYLAASALACETGRIGMYEVSVVRRDPEGAVEEVFADGDAAWPS
ncbi:class I SAM-dependent methyltransferase [Actinomadura scrupuli]|uniref:class I SAM-dependent methyltransferase n=1 Tax=Actinomadura scrupuli TaxID=559629 RepID=UPI003D982791